MRLLERAVLYQGWARCRLESCCLSAAWQLLSSDSQLSTARLPLAAAVHAAWSGAGLGFLCLWLLGTLRCFAGGAARPAQLVASLLPLAAAGWIGLTRVQNNR